MFVINIKNITFENRLDYVLKNQDYWRLTIPENKNQESILYIILLN